MTNFRERERERESRQSEADSLTVSKNPPKRGNSNSALNSAKAAKNDEFYTQLSDIEKEVSHYAEQLKGKTVFCNCDDPAESNFFLFFLQRFKLWKLKKIIATHYVSEGTSYKIEINKAKTADEIYRNIKSGCDFNCVWNREMLTYKGVLTPLTGNGDFRNEECIKLLKQSDVVITNPPFSMFREYVATLIEHSKKFLIIGNINAVSYKEIFPLMMHDKLWLGESIHSGDRAFYVPDYYPLEAATCGINEHGKKFIRVKGVRWFTNILTSTSARNEILNLYKRYTPSEYPKYDNYEAIEVGKVADIPMDYDGLMGVPITFLDKYNPKQFEIIGLDRYVEGNTMPNKRMYLNGKEIYARIIIRRR